MTIYRRARGASDSLLREARTRIMRLDTLAWAPLTMALLVACGATDNGGGDEDEAPAPVHLGHCFERMGNATFPLDPAVRESIEGSNGTFVEACDDQKNLIAYHCDMQIRCGGTLDCAPFPTGVVSPVTYDCQGHCEDGACTD